MIDSKSKKEDFGHINLIESLHSFIRRSGIKKRGRFRSIENLRAFLELVRVYHNFLSFSILKNKVQPAFLFWYETSNLSRRRFTQRFMAFYEVIIYSKAFSKGISRSLVLKASHSFDSIFQQAVEQKWCSGRDLNPGLRLERPPYLTGLYYRSSKLYYFTLFPNIFSSCLYWLKANGMRIVIPSVLLAIA